MQVDSIQCVGASENVTRQLRALHDIEVELAQTKQQPCDAIRCVGKHQKFNSSTSQVIDGVCCETTLKKVFHILCAILVGTLEHVRIVSGCATGSNLMEQPFQYHSLLNRESWCFCGEQKQ